MLWNTMLCLNNWGTSLFQNAHAGRGKGTETGWEDCSLNSPSHVLAKGSWISWKENLSAFIYLNCFSPSASLGLTFFSSSPAFFSVSLKFPLLKFKYDSLLSYWPLVSKSRYTSELPECLAKCLAKNRFSKHSYRVNVNTSRVTVQ